MATTASNALPAPVAVPVSPRRGHKLWSAAMAALVLGACGDSDSADAALNPIDAAALRGTVETLARDMLVPGAVVLLKTPRGDFSTTYGVSAYKGSTPTAYDQHVRVGSNTKSWVGTVILQQVQEGLLALHDPVSKYRPGVPNGAAITIEQLLNMRSGLFNYTTTDEFNRRLDEEPLKVWTPEELLAMGFARAPESDPGERFDYSNTNTVLLGLIAQQVEHGKPLQDILRDRLFVPLGLSHTFLPAASSNLLPEPRSRGYMYGNNVLTNGKALPAPMQAEARAGTIDPVDYTDANPSWGWAAGAGISTATELLRWVQAMVGGNLLNADLQARRLASVQTIEPGNPASAGYGWALAKFGPLYGHTGELPGYNSFMGHDPVNRVTLVVWTNLAPAPDGRDPATAIADALIGKIYAAPK